MIKYIKENLYIPVGALLVLMLLTIIINGIYVGYVQYSENEDTTMYGLMYVGSDGERLYVTNTGRGSTSDDISNIAELAQHKTAVLAAKALLKNGWLDDDDGELYVVEIAKVAVNIEKMDKPKQKEGFFICYDVYDKNGKLVTEYYRGPQSREYYSSNEFTDSITPSTAFKTEKKALAAWESIFKSMRESEGYYNDNMKRWGRPYSNNYKDYTERNDHIERTARILNYASCN
ncbi:hypothetical protein ACETM9_003518 [Salmonella enterica]